jgi:hypothetical protein
MKIIRASFQRPFGLRLSDFSVPSGFGFRVSGLPSRLSQQGIALVIVMISIMVLTVLAAGTAKPNSNGWGAPGSNMRVGSWRIRC